MINDWEYEVHVKNKVKETRFTSARIKNTTDASKVTIKIA